MSEKGARRREEGTDRVVLLYRPGYYGEGEEDQAEVILAKNRFGPTGFRSARWDAKSGVWGANGQ